MKVGTESPNVWGEYKPQHIQGTTIPCDMQINIPTFDMGLKKILGRLQRQKNNGRTNV